MTGPSSDTRDTGPSHVRGATEPPLPGFTIGESLALTAAAHPDRDALASPAQAFRLTWHELDRQVDTLAAGLIDLGLQAGDRVGLWSMNAAEWVIAQLATARAGLVLVTINPAYRVAELRHALRAADCALVIVGPAYRGSDYAAMMREVLAPGYGSLLRTPIMVQFGAPAQPGFLPWDGVMDRGRGADPAPLARRAAAVRDTDPVNIQFTSGTTGLPKGVTLSHRNIANNGWFTGEALGLHAGDRLCLPVPLYHCFGMVTGVLLSVSRGVTLVLPSPGFDPAATLAAIADECCTALYGVPTMYRAMLAHAEFDSAALASLRTGIMAGSLCPVELMQAAIDRMHMRDIAICYGMTEAPVSFQTARDDPLARRLDTVGRVQPHIEAKLVDAQGATVPFDTPGEICVRGYDTMLGYWGDEAATRATRTADGWIRTGDLGEMDREGYLRIVGRLKDMVIRGGENLYPKEIEEFLLGHPEIDDVQVFGVADETFGEELCAWIVRSAGAAIDEEAVRGFCRGRIAHHKIPRHIRFVTEFPMTVTGKVQKSVLRRMMETELGLPAEPTGPA